ncbi:hypothetical protein N7468_004258 [Penicillium chermesinum]|uniref:BZIP domain-containing protein n=1 Tax=Penicillium chermesinum TaxID=63820 RepID=A0A9W9P880_9EURO|nr:uncharacterized protein N7468_004258 [Penicillium chermesinum]KAJ5239639.1 hypothetical protein N7468_004258 [Penicillium chermesinum]KAJ6166527.1 hypothetical protein N7470_001974 [Penicillium chermesinum]
MDFSNFAEHQSQSFPLYGLPTPDHKPLQNPDEALRDPFALSSFNQYFPGYDSSLRIDPSSYVPPPHSPPDSFTKHSAGSSDHANYTNQDQALGDGDEVHLPDPPVARSSSEEKDSSVPAQSKRKAQNRAAQRAFRERKERHVKDLEEKVLSLEEASNNLRADNERLKRELAKFATENEILRATSSLNAGNNNSDRSVPTTVNGPMTFTPTDFYTKLADGEEWADNPMPNPTKHRLLYCKKTGERLFDIGETWDLIQADKAFKEGLVDIAVVVKNLKGMAQCSGQGPAFRERDIKKAMMATISDRDQLI